MDQGAAHLIPYGLNTYPPIPDSPTLSKPAQHVRFLHRRSNNNRYFCARKNRYYRNESFNFPILPPREPLVAPIGHRHCCRLGHDVHLLQATAFSRTQPFRHHFLPIRNRRNVLGSQVNWVSTAIYRPEMCTFAVN